jgi:hypothetical protein
MTTTINYTVFKIHEINDQASGHAHNNIYYEINEFSFKKSLKEKKWLSSKDITDHIKTISSVLEKGSYAGIFEWHLN